MGKPDLNKLREEIDNRKKNSPTQQSNLGGVAARDSFLNGLVESLQTGKETHSTNLVKSVDNQAAIKKGETPRHNVSEVQQKRPETNIQQTTTSHRRSIDDTDREEKMWKDFESKKSGTLADAMDNYVTTRNKTNSNPQNYGNYPQNHDNHLQNYNGYSQNPNAIQPQQLNEGILYETMTKYVNENYGRVIEEAIKGTIMEMYGREKILSVLNENKDIIKKMVYDIIREIQSKSKKRNS